MKKQILFFLTLLQALFADGAYYYSGGVKHELFEAKQARGLAKPGYRYFTDAKGRSLGVADTLLVKFKEGADIDAVSKKYSLLVVEKLDNETYLLKSSQDSIAVSNTLVESGEVVFAHPDFLIKKELRTLDPLFSQAWHLQNTGQNGGKVGADINAIGAWAITKGKGVKVAIFDDAVDVNHEDLKDALIAQYDFDNDVVSAMPTANDQEHGTAVAGLALARENSLGSVGVAPEASMIAIKQFDSAVSKTVKAFNWAKSQGADVINCSWGTGNPPDAEVAAINDLATNGRGGKGAIVVFAAPNDNSDLGSDESALPNVIGVGASDNTDLRAWYSSYGTELDLVAPSGGGTLKLCSTDISGDMGYAKISSGHPDYIYATDSTGFSGTSGSAPIVSGVAALMLAANPDLTRAQVYDVLTGTADKIGTLPYTGGKNIYYGYGRVNAGAAVAKAKSMRAGQGSYGSYSLTVYKGWNLVSVPFSGTAAYSDLVDGVDVVRMYSYSNAQNNYLQPSLLQAGSGYWLYALASKSISFKPLTIFQGSFDISSIVSSASAGWNLSGVPSDTANSYIKSLGATAVWAYVNATNGYTLPDTLPAGMGFWLKK